MDRRQFLKVTAGGGALVGVAIALPVIAQTIFKNPEPEITPVVPVHPYQKYIDALRMFDETIALYPVGMRTYGSWPCKTPEYESWLGTDNPKKMHAKVDELIAHMHTHWEIPEHSKENRKEVDNLLQGFYCEGWKKADYEKHFRSVPPLVADAVWPVLMMKTLLRDYALPINHRQLTHWKEFHNRYGWFILDA